MDFRCAQKLALQCAFGTTGMNLTVFMAPCNELAKYFFTGAHLQYIWQEESVPAKFHLDQCKVLPCEAKNPKIGPVIISTMAKEVR